MEVIMGQTTLLSQFLLASAGGTIGAALTQSTTIFREWRNGKAEGRFTALMLALALEDHANKCTTPYFDLNNYASSRQQTAEPTGSIPPLPEYPDKFNWRSIGVNHTAEVLQYRVLVDAAQSYLSFAWQVDGNAGVWADASEKGIELGAAALRIAAKLRNNFGLPPKIKQANFDIDEFITKATQEIKDQKKRAHDSWKALQETGSI
jgi:hypothetical protein